MSNFVHFPTITLYCSAQMSLVLFHCCFKYNTSHARWSHKIIWMSHLCSLALCAIEHCHISVSYMVSSYHSCTLCLYCYTISTSHCLYAASKSVKIVLLSHINTRPIYTSVDLILSIIALCYLMTCRPSIRLHLGGGVSQGLLSHQQTVLLHVTIVQLTP